MSKELEKAIQLVEEKLRAEKPYLFTIEDEIEKLDKGIITFSFRVFEGKVTDVTLQSTLQRKIFTKP